MDKGGNNTTMDWTINEDFEKKRLACGCIQHYYGCLFCDPELILQDILSEARKKYLNDLIKV